MPKPQDLGEVCNHLFYSQSGVAEKKRAKDYIINRLGYPDQGSNFERELGLLKYVFRIPLLKNVIATVGIWYLRNCGYDAVSLENHDTVMGCTGFQIHPDESIHVFAIEVPREYQGMGFGVDMEERVLEYAKQRHLKSMRIGGGNHDASNRIHQIFCERQEELGIVARDKNWIDILYEQP